MNRSRFVSVFLAALLFVLPAGSVEARSFLDAISGFFSGVNVVSVQQEAELSATFAQEVEKNQQVVRDARIVGYVESLGSRLASTVRNPEFRYTFRVVADPSVNAFNIGGGRVYVHTGLIAASKTEGELVSVLSHEMGHQVHRHVAKAISRDQVFRTLASFAVGEKASQWVQLAAGLGITTGQLHFGREAEREADREMVGLMVRAGYDPREALGMFETIRSLQRGEPGRVAGMFSSHPPTSERIDDVKRLIARASMPSGLRKDSNRFREVRDLVRRSTR